MFVVQGGDALHKQCIASGLGKQLPQCHRFTINMGRCRHLYPLHVCPQRRSTNQARQERDDSSLSRRVQATLQLLQGSVTPVSASLEQNAASTQQQSCHAPHALSYTAGRCCQQVDPLNNSMSCFKVKTNKSCQQPPILYMSSATSLDA